MVTPILLKYDDDHEDLSASHIPETKLSQTIEKSDGKKKVSERRKT